MKISLILIGDELLNGRINDLNGAWLAKFLFDNDHDLVQILTIRDDERTIHQALKSSLEIADIVITSGGLGPTKDDKTKQALASFFQKAVLQNDMVIPLIKKNYEFYGKEWSPESNQYHFIPDSFEAIPNPCGLAPGLSFKQNQKIIFCAPGVPSEFAAMVEKEFFPKFDRRTIPTQQVVIRTFGVPEEKIFFELCPTLWDDLESFGKVSSLPQKVGIDILVTFQGNEQKKSEIQKEIELIVEATPLKENVWQYGNLTLAEYVLQKAKEKKVTLAFAESCTGGLAASSLTDIAGSSENFLGSVVSYANELKVGFLGVKEETLKNHGAVSEECALEMAQGIQKETGADFVLSFTGIAGPGGGSPEKPVGTVAIGWGHKDSIQSDVFRFRGDRIKLKNRFCQFGLLKLLNTLKS